MTEGEKWAGLPHFVWGGHIFFAGCLGISTWRNKKFVGNFSLEQFNLLCKFSKFVEFFFDYFSNNEDSKAGKINIKA